MILTLLGVGAVGAFNHPLAVEVEAVRVVERPVGVGIGLDLDAPAEGVVFGHQTARLPTAAHAVAHPSLGALAPDGASGEWGDSTALPPTDCAEEPKIKALLVVCK